MVFMLADCAAIVLVLAMFVVPMCTTGFELRKNRPNNCFSQIVVTKKKQRRKCIWIPFLFCLELQFFFVLPALLG